MCFTLTKIHNVFLFILKLFNLKKKNYLQNQHQKSWTIPPQRCLDNPGRSHQLQMKQNIIKKQVKSPSNVLVNTKIIKIIQWTTRNLTSKISRVEETTALQHISDELNEQTWNYNIINGSTCCLMIIIKFLDSVSLLQSQLLQYS
jgi:hypothetical protein